MRYVIGAKRVAGSKPGAVIVAAAVLLALAVSLAGCGSDVEPEIVNRWPEAAGERTVPEPPRAAVWPLTGEAIADGEDASHRVISVKIENSAAARPQSGLQQADVVYETVVEGGITRFNALYHSVLPDPVGPVRSARLSDRFIVPQYDAIFLYSGASDSVYSALARVRFDNLSQDVGVDAPAYYRSSQRRSPHNLYLHLPEVYSVAEARGIETTGAIKALAFDEPVAVSSPETRTVTGIVVPFSDVNTATWRYDAESGLYGRWHNGSSHRDASTNEQISARNVVVVWAKYVTQSTVDAAGSRTYDVMLEGTGKMTLFRDGQRYEGTWEMAPDAPPVLKNADGIELRLAPGNTWFQVVATSVNITLE